MAVGPVTPWLLSDAEDQTVHCALQRYARYREAVEHKWWIMLSGVEVAMVDEGRQPYKEVDHGVDEHIPKLTLDSFMPLTQGMSSVFWLPAVSERDQSLVAKRFQ